ncbi:MAG: FAD:protein FMN transferase, partial [bacterium]|nr:FAD:protein FMN transferase [bacterium]
CQSVTILAPSTEQADVMATAVFIMGPEQGLEFIETHADIEGMIVDAHGEIVKSSGFSFQPK